MPRNISGWLIPEIIDPIDTFCISFSVPNEPRHLDAFYGQIEELARWYNWQKTGDNKGAQVAAVWRQIIKNAKITDYCTLPLYDLRQTGILIERQNSPGGGWSTLYDPRPYVLIKSPTSLYQNTVNAPSGVAGLNLLSVVGARASTDDSILYVVAGWGAPAAIFKRQDIAAPYTATVEIEHNLTGGIQPGIDFLRAKDTAGNKFGGINAYGNPVLRRYTSALPTANADHYGSLAMLGNGSTDNALWYCDYNAGTATYYWRKGVGEPGEDGTPGEDGDPGHGIAVLDPALQEVLNPNEEPEMVIDDALPSTTFVGWKLPRAAEVFMLEPIIGTPGEDLPDVALSTTTEGDVALQFVVVAGQDGEDGEDAGDLDDELPALGATKTYKQIILADSGSLAPFVATTGTTIQSMTAKGRWQVTYPTTIPPQYAVLTKDGEPPPTGTINVGKLMIGVKAVTDTGEFDYFPYDELPLELAVDSYIKFAQHRTSDFQFGSGYLQGEYEIRRGLYTWEWDFDFTAESFAAGWSVQSGGLTWSANGWQSSAGLWYGQLGMTMQGGIAGDTVVNEVLVEVSSNYSTPGSGYTNKAGWKYNTTGTLVTNQDDFPYPLGQLTFPVSLALPNSNSFHSFFADSADRAAHDQYVRLRRFRMRGIGTKPTITGL